MEDSFHCRYLKSLQLPVGVALSACLSSDDSCYSVTLLCSAPAHKLLLKHIRQAPHHKAFAVAVPSLKSTRLLDTSFRFRLSCHFLNEVCLFCLFNNTACSPVSYSELSSPSLGFPFSFSVALSAS